MFLLMYLPELLYNALVDEQGHENVAPVHDRLCDEAGEVLGGLGGCGGSSRGNIADATANRVAQRNDVRCILNAKLLVRHKEFI